MNKENDNKTRNIVIGVLGILLLAGIIFYFINSNKKIDNVNTINNNNSNQVLNDQNNNQNQNSQNTENNTPDLNNDNTQNNNLLNKINTVDKQKKDIKIKINKLENLEL